jgi:hypothetical protein
VIRKLNDNTLLVFLSDCHIGGDQGRDIFESADDLGSLFSNLDSHLGPVELILAGDFFDLLRIANVPEGENRASATIDRHEYRDLFAALRQFAAGQDRRVVYLPGDHDAEAWWNREVRAELERQGLVHDFALSYTASFESDPDRVVYCEHGNQFDPANRFTDFDDPLDTPLGDHIVTDFVPRLPRGWATEGGNLPDIDRVFPLTSIPEWLVGRLFYQLAKQILRWLFLPLLVFLTVHEVLAYAFGHHGGALGLVLDLLYDVGLLLIVFAVSLVAAGRIATRTVRSSAHRFRDAHDPRSKARSSRAHGA